MARLFATAGDNSVSLNWNDNTELDLDSYNVYRSTTSGGYGAALATGVATSDYVDNTAVNGTTYYYVVTAIDTSSHESNYSNEVSKTPSDAPPFSGNRYMENLGRGVVAVRKSSGAFVSWRLLGLDPAGIGFNLYRSAAGQRSN